MVVLVSDLPDGTPNRLNMRVGCYILYAVATTAVLLRLYVRLFMSGRPGLDDVFIVVAWVAETAAIATVKLMFENGIGWHLSDLAVLPDGMAILTRMVLWPWVAQILYFFGVGCIKSSIVALYLRLAVSPLQRRILWGILLFVFVQGLSSALTVAAFLCSPISVVWTGSHGGFGGPACINILAFNYYNAALFIFTDLCLAAAPIYILKDLQMDRRRKASLGIMFALGSLAIGGTISRQVTNAIAINATSDFTWHWAPAELCSILESSLGILFVCVPAMAPLFTSFFSTFGSTGRGYKSDRPSTFAKLSGKPRLHPNDERILFETQITSGHPRHGDRAVESYEMDPSHYSGDSGSESRIVIKDKEASTGQKQLTDKRSNDDQMNIRVNVEYDINHSAS